jgi:hypothetical protein
MHGIIEDKTKILGQKAAHNATACPLTTYGLVNYQSRSFVVRANTYPKETGP